MGLFVSVVMPTHGRPDRLRRALESLAAQTYPRDQFEVIVIPTPGDPGIGVAAEVAAATGLDLICQPVPDDSWGGRSASAKRNHGGRLAIGDWLGFIDDDCVADPGWLAGAAMLLAGGTEAVEGRTVIPPPPRPTRTYLGMKSFEEPGGYQSCNMFYRRDVFLAVGGFDLRFPYYLEDTDLAWTLLERGRPIPFAEMAVVRHPVPPADPWRLLEDCRRAALHALLRRKHPDQYQQHGWSPLRVRHIGYVVAVAVLAIASPIVPGAAAIGMLTLFALSALDTVRQYFGLYARPGELAVITLLNVVDGPYRLWWFLRGLMAFRNATTGRPPLTPCIADG